jgi:hypothetical protein
MGVNVIGVKDDDRVGPGGNRRDEGKTEEQADQCSCHGAGVDLRHGVAEGPDGHGWLFGEARPGIFVVKFF